MSLFDKIFKTKTVVEKTRIGILYESYLKSRRRIKYKYEHLSKTKRLKSKLPLVDKSKFLYDIPDSMIFPNSSEADATEENADAFLKEFGDLLDHDFYLPEAILIHLGLSHLIEPSKSSEEVQESPAIENSDDDCVVISDDETPLVLASVHSTKDTSHPLGSSKCSLSSNSKKESLVKKKKTNVLNRVSENIKKSSKHSISGKVILRSNKKIQSNKKSIVDSKVETSLHLPTNPDEIDITFDDKHDILRNPPKLYNHTVMYCLAYKDFFERINERKAEAVEKSLRKSKNQSLCDSVDEDLDKTSNSESVIDENVSSTEINIHDKRKLENINNEQPCKKLKHSYSDYINEHFNNLKVNFSFGKCNKNSISDQCDTLVNASSSNSHNTGQMSPPHTHGSIVDHLMTNSLPNTHQGAKTHIHSDLNSSSTQGEHLPLSKTNSDLESVDTINLNNIEKEITSEEVMDQFFNQNNFDNISVTNSSDLSKVQSSEQIPTTKDSSVDSERNVIVPEQNKIIKDTNKPKIFLRKTADLLQSTFNNSFESGNIEKTSNSTDVDIFVRTSASPSGLTEINCEKLIETHDKSIDISTKDSIPSSISNSTGNIKTKKKCNHLKGRRDDENKIKESSSKTTVNTLSNPQNKDIHPFARAFTVFSKPSSNITNSECAIQKSNSRISSNFNSQLSLDTLSHLISKSKSRSNDSTSDSKQISPKTISPKNKSSSMSQSKILPQLDSSRSSSSKTKTHPTSNSNISKQVSTDSCKSISQSNILPQLDSSSSSSSKTTTHSTSNSNISKQVFTDSSKSKSSPDHHLLKEMLGILKKNTVDIQYMIRSQAMLLDKMPDNSHSVQKEVGSISIDVQNTHDNSIPSSNAPSNGAELSECTSCRLPKGQGCCLHFSKLRNIVFLNDMSAKKKIAAMKKLILSSLPPLHP